MTPSEISAPGGPPPGRPVPLGAHVTEAPDGTPGTSFAVVSGVAESLTLCLLADDGTETRVPMDAGDAGDAGAWHVFVPGVGAGARYGFRADGPFDPARGLRTNPAKLLVDPYARATVGALGVGPAVLGHDVDDPARPSSLDSAAHVPRSLVVAPAPGRDERAGPAHALADSIVYEVHVKGFTMRHPGVPPELRGTYAGLAHDAAIGHLVDLGVTTVELLPVHQHVSEAALVARGLTNYWGYNPLGYFAPHAEYSAEVRAGRPGGQVDEFADMVRALHAAGLDVWLDVVFNHTCEGDADGPTLCWRGLDNGAYYRLDPADPSRYLDTTGCGNSIDANHPVALRMITDSLRYWVTEMGVDGFRFDLAATLARGDDGAFRTTSAFLDAIAQDPVLSQVALVAEPWDVGQPDSYALGRFPTGWSEWNGRYRDTARDFWRGRDGTLSDVATRLAGSADLFAAAGRPPSASVNYVTAHDGFTLADLVAYEHKHNEANGQDNRDGTDDNRSSNGGVEGETDDPAVLATRGRRARAMLTTLLCSFGVPMLLGGDELGRTQRGNNNAYCHDDELSWFEWSAVDTDMLAFTRRLVALRRAHPVFRRRRFVAREHVDELAWCSAAGVPMTDAEWRDPSVRAVAVLFEGAVLPDHDAGPAGALDDDFLLLVNGWREGVRFTLPPSDAEWSIELATEDPALAPGPPRHAGDEVVVGPESIVVLRSPRRH